MLEGRKSCRNGYTSSADRRRRSGGPGLGLFDRGDGSRDHRVANAIGAALARTTMSIELLADTEKGILIIRR